MQKVEATKCRPRWNVLICVLPSITQVAFSSMLASEKSLLPPARHAEAQRISSRERNSNPYTPTFGFPQANHPIHFKVLTRTVVEYRLPRPPLWNFDLFEKMSEVLVRIVVLSEHSKKCRSKGEGKAPQRRRMGKIERRCQKKENK